VRPRWVPVAHTCHCRSGERVDWDDDAAREEGGCSVRSGCDCRQACYGCAFVHVMALGPSRARTDGKEGGHIMSIVWTWRRWFRDQDATQPGQLSAQAHERGWRVTEV